MITGQLVFLDRGNDTLSGRKNHRLVMVVGIISVPDDAPINCKHTVCSFDSASLVIAGTETLTDAQKRETPNGLLTSPMWRV